MKGINRVLLIRYMMLYINNTRTKSVLFAYNFPLVVSFFSTKTKSKYNVLIPYFCRRPDDFYN